MGRNEVICKIIIDTDDKKETTNLLIDFLKNAEFKGKTLKETVSDRERLKVDVITKEQLYSWYTEH